MPLGVPTFAADTAYSMLPPNLPRDIASLAPMVLLMGMKHGLDADHLAAIDGLTRFNAQPRPRLARSAGALFAVGHGSVLASAAAAMGALSHAWSLPRWLEAFGAWMSIAVLTALALTNLVAVMKTPGHEVAHLHGWRGGMFASLLRARSPALVIGVGILFAVSFETVSQAALIAALATPLGGWKTALALGTCFFIGMLLIDGVNGAWVARLIRRSDRMARVASRALVFAVSGAGLLTVGLTLVTQAQPGVDAWAQGKELWFGATVAAIVGLGFAIGRALARRRPQTLGSE